MPPAPARPAEDSLRYFILCTGRSGSTLLAAILADCGAEFGMPNPDDWDRAGGDLEHPLVSRCSLLFRRAGYIQGGKRYFLLYKYMIDNYRSRGKKLLRRALAEARFVKAMNVDLWLWHVPKFGYQPRMIVSYRAFGETARSYFVRTGIRLPEFADYYRRTYGNALLMMDVFGGCAVSWEELADPAETGWADALSQATGFDRDALLASRARRLKPEDGAGDNRPKVPLHDEASEKIYRELRSLSGIYVPPSHQFRRKIDRPAAG